MTTLNDNRLEQFHNRVAALGRKEGEGHNARPDFGQELFLAAADGLIVVGKGDDNAVLHEWRRYSKAAASKRDFKGSDDVNKKSEKAQTSKANQLVIAGGIPMFLKARQNGMSTVAKDWMDLVRARITELDKVSAKAVPVYDKMVAVAREQIKVCKKNKDHPPLDAEQIDAVLTKPAKSPEELSEIKQIFTKLGKLADKWKESAEALGAAQDALVARITELQEEAEDSEADKAIASMTPEQMLRMEEKIAAAKAAKAAPMLQAAE